MPVPVHMVPMSLRALATGLLLLALIASPVKSQSESEFSELADSLTRALMVEFDVPAVALSVVADGALLVERAYGEADAAGTRATTRTLFNVASLSKPVTALGILRLAAEGSIELHAPVGNFLRGWSLPPSDFDQNDATILRVLAHSGGLSLAGWPGFGPADELPSLVEVLSGSDAREGVVVEYPPGSESRYSGGGYALLQMLIEEASGERYEDYMRRSVLRPLGMSWATFEDPLHLPPERLAQPSEFAGRWLPQERFRAVAAAGMFATAKDASNLLRFELGDGPAGFLPDSLRAWTRTPLPPSEFWAAGHAIRRVGQQTVIGHTGVNVGWRATFQVLPDARAGIAVFTNSDTGEYLASELVCVWGRRFGAVDLGECDVVPSERIARRNLKLGLGAGLIVLMAIGLQIARRLRRRRRATHAA